MGRSIGLCTAAIVAATSFLAACDGVSRRGGLIRLSGPADGELARRILDADDPDARREAINELSQRPIGRDEGMLRVFAAVLRRDQEAPVRTAAARALGRGQDRQFVTDLAAALEADAAAPVRQAAADSLGQLGGPQAAHPLLVALGDDESMDVRMAAARALRGWYEPEVLQGLIDALDDPEFSVRHEALTLLRALTGRRRGYDPQQWQDYRQEPLPPRRR